MSVDHQRIMMTLLLGFFRCSFFFLAPRAKCHLVSLYLRNSATHTKTIQTDKWHHMQEEEYVFLISRQTVLLGFVSSPWTEVLLDTSIWKRQNGRTNNASGSTSSLSDWSHKNKSLETYRSQAPLTGLNWQSRHIQVSSIDVVKAADLAYPHLHI